MSDIPESQIPLSAEALAAHRTRDFPLAHWEWKSKGEDIFRNVMRLDCEVCEGAVIQPRISSPYKIPVDELMSDRGALHWMLHIRSKSWMTPEMFFEFFAILAETRIVKRGM